jgi:hypothetical protein
MCLQYNNRHIGEYIVTSCCIFYCEHSEIIYTRCNWFKTAFSYYFNLYDNHSRVHLFLLNSWAQSWSDRAQWAKTWDIFGSIQDTSTMLSSSTFCGTVPEKVKLKSHFWEKMSNCSVFTGSRDSEAEQLYKKVEQSKRWRVPCCWRRSGRICLRPERFLKHNFHYHHFTISLRKFKKISTQSKKW